MIEVLGAFVFGVLVLCFVIWVIKLAIEHFGLPAPIGQIVLGLVALVGLYVLWTLALPVLRSLG